MIIKNIQNLEDYKAKLIKERQIILFKIRGDKSGNKPIKPIIDLNKGLLDNFKPQETEQEQENEQEQATITKNKQNNQIISDLIQQNQIKLKEFKEKIEKDLKDYEKETELLKYKAMLEQIEVIITEINEAIAKGKEVISTTEHLGIKEVWI